MDPDRFPQTGYLINIVYNYDYVFTKYKKQNVDWNRMSLVRNV